MSIFFGRAYTVWMPHWFNGTVTSFDATAMRAECFLPFFSFFDGDFCLPLLGGVFPRELPLGERDLLDPLDPFGDLDREGLRERDGLPKLPFLPFLPLRCLNLQELPNLQLPFSK